MIDNQYDSDPDNRPCNHPEGRIDYRVKPCGCTEDWCIICDSCISTASCEAHDTSEFEEA